MDYLDYLKSKSVKIEKKPIKYGQIHEKLFPFQKEVVEHLLKIGRGAAFLDTGLGKTIIQCEWARHIPGNVLFIAPLAVAQQTIKEAKNHLGMDIVYSKEGNIDSKYTITNYERIENFDCEKYEAVVLDESSILKGFMSKTKRLLCDLFKNTPYKLACTATPAPNDHMELGNHAEFLGIMPSTEMLVRWFINDPGQVGKYVLKGHAVKPFWEWVASWAACVSKPSDLGYDDAQYNLPKLQIETKKVSVDVKSNFDEGLLFDIPQVNASSLHKSKRATLERRVELVAKMVNESQETFIVWCESNDESAALKRAIPDAVEVKGSDSPDTKEERLVGFSEGKYRVLISKSSICGFGMNWQHCKRMVFASISYSYEKFYQAVRRSWRFGQKDEVRVFVVISDDETPVWRVIEKKSKDHTSMKNHMKYAIFKKAKNEKIKIPYKAEKKGEFPAWL